MTGLHENLSPLSHHPPFTRAFTYFLLRLWKLVLTNQFHDVIPGTSIGPVYVDAHNWYKEVYELGGGFLETALSAVATKNKAQSEGQFIPPTRPVAACRVSPPTRTTLSTKILFYC